MNVVHRWLAGEVVNSTVGIKLTGGPFNGRTKIVQLGRDGLPPARLRSRDGQGQGPWKPAARHTYTSVPAPHTPAGWTYEYTGVDAFTDG
ncbi:hypothetical protein ACWGLE_06195 [Streptomyces sp. NPDC055897]